MEDKLILVDENDIAIGEMSKLLAHQLGKLHRAFSIFIFNDKGELLIQQRAPHKYHCPGLWANTCCSHPRPNETTHDAAYRRLYEELGFNTKLNYVDAFIYRAEVGSGLIEHEYDHIFIGYYNGPIKPNPNEVESIKWIDTQQLIYQMNKSPEKFTPWLKEILTKFPEFEFFK